MAEESDQSRLWSVGEGGFHCTVLVKGKRLVFTLSYCGLTYTASVPGACGEMITWVCK